MQRRAVKNGAVPMNIVGTNDMSVVCGVALCGTSSQMRACSWIRGDSEMPLWADSLNLWILLSVYNSNIQTFVLGTMFKTLSNVFHMGN